MTLRHFHRNVGVWGIVRGGGISLVMLGLALDAFVRAGQIAPLAAFAVAVTLPLSLHRQLVAHLEVTGVVVRFIGYALVGAAALSPVWLDRVPGGADGTFRTVLVCVAGLYLSAWFAVCSDPKVVTAYARRRSKADRDAGIR